MIFLNKTYRRIINKYLEKYGTTMEELERAEGVVNEDGKKKIYWWQKYEIDEEEYGKWQKELCKAIQGEHEDWDEVQVLSEFRTIDVLWGIPTPWMWIKKEEV